MPVLSANIRTFNAYAESPKLYNSFLWLMPGGCLELARGEKCEPDSGRLRRKRGSPQAWRPSQVPRAPPCNMGGRLGLRTAGFSLPLTTDWPGTIQPRVGHGKYSQTSLVPMVPPDLTHSGQVIDLTGILLSAFPHQLPTLSCFLVLIMINLEIA